MGSCRCVGAVVVGSYCADSTLGRSPLSSLHTDYDVSSAPAREAALGPRGVVGLWSALVDARMPGHADGVVDA
eukprot:1677865-Pyramimonas_sp.AAC.1